MCRVCTGKSRRRVNVHPRCDGFCEPIAEYFTMGFLVEISVLNARTGIKMLVYMIRRHIAPCAVVRGAPIVVITILSKSADASSLFLLY